MFFIHFVHPDWYEDGIEKGRSDIENLWRLDFAVGSNAFQAQLFAKLGMTEEQYDQLLEKPQLMPYASFRLFIERDNRHDGGGPRIDYACDGWEITEEEGRRLLTSNSADAVAAMSDKIDRVAKLPCQPQYLDKRSQIGEYGAKEVS